LSTTGFQLTQKQLHDGSWISLPGIITPSLLFDAMWMLEDMKVICD